MKLLKKFLSVWILSWSLLTSQNMARAYDIYASAPNEVQVEDEEESSNKKEKQTGGTGGSADFRYCQQLVGGSQAWATLVSKSRNQSAETIFQFISEDVLQYLKEQLQARGNQMAGQAVLQNLVDDYYKGTYDETKGKKTLQSAAKGVRNNLQTKYERISRCVAYAAVTHHVNYSNSADTTPGGTATTMDGTVTCETDGAETQDFPGCRSFVTAYNVFMVSDVAMSATQEVVYESKAMDREYDLQLLMNDPDSTEANLYKESLKVQLKGIKDQASIAYQKAAFFVAKAGVLAAGLNSTPSRQEIHGDCMKAFGTTGGIPKIDVQLDLNIKPKQQGQQGQQQAAQQNQQQQNSSGQQGSGQNTAAKPVAKASSNTLEGKYSDFNSCYDGEKNTRLGSIETAEKQAYDDYHENVKSCPTSTEKENIDCKKELLDTYNRNIDKLQKQVNELDSKIQSDCDAIDWNNKSAFHKIIFNNILELILPSAYAQCGTGYVSTSSGCQPSTTIVSSSPCGTGQTYSNGSCSPSSSTTTSSPCGSGQTVTASGGCSAPASGTSNSYGYGSSGSVEGIEGGEVTSRGITLHTQIQEAGKMPDACEVVSEGTVIKNEGARTAMQQALAQALADFAGALATAILLDKQAKMLEKLIGDLKESTEYPEFEIPDPLLLYCERNPTDTAVCSNLSGLFSNQGWADGGITITGRDSMSTADLTDSNGSQNAAGSATEGTTDSAGVGSYVEPATFKDDFTAPKAATATNSPAGGAGGAGGAGAPAVSAPGGGSSSGDHTAAPAPGLPAKTAGVSYTGGTSKSYSGGTARVTAKNNVTNPLSGLVKNNGGSLEFDRAPASTVAPKDKSIFDVISSRYTKLNTEKRLKEYEIIEVKK